MIARAKGFPVRIYKGFDRLIASIYRIPDRIPVLGQFYIYAIATHGLSAKVFFSEPKTFHTCNIQLCPLISA